MENWFIFAVVAFILFGFWGFFPKITLRYIDPKSALIYGIIGSAITGIFVLFILGPKLKINPKGMIFAFLTGMAGVLGTLFVLLALNANKDKLSSIIMITALNPVLVILLAFFILKESINFQQFIGIIFALIAIILFAS